jgi:hypothetical protein
VTKFSWADPLRMTLRRKPIFGFKDLETHLKRNNFLGMAPGRMAQRVRDLGGEPITLYLKGRQTRCWRIPKFERQDAPFETPEQNKVSPF